MAKSSLYREYMKERHRVQNFMNRTSKRGFAFKPNILPDIPKRVTRQSIERLKKLTPEKLYEKATYTTSEGKMISGKEGRYQEKRKSAIKSSETRKRNFEERRRRKDQEEQDRFNDEDWKNQFYVGNIILSRVREMIEQARVTKPNAADDLEDILNAEIAEYGLTAVCMNIANAPEDMVARAQDALRYNPGHPIHEAAIIKIREIITGEILSMEQARKQQDKTDEDEVYNEV